jgi:hypothetical protein
MKKMGTMVCGVAVSVVKVSVSGDGCFLIKLISCMFLSGLSHSKKLNNEKEGKTCWPI